MENKAYIGDDVNGRAVKVLGITASHDLQPQAAQQVCFKLLKRSVSGVD